MTAALLLLATCSFAQEKYFEKTGSLLRTNSGHEIVMINDTTFMIFGGAYTFAEEAVFHALVCKSNLQGQFYSYRDYHYIDSNNLLVNWWVTNACKGADGTFAFVGRYDTPSGQADFYSYAYLTLVNEQCDSTAFYTLLPEGYQYSDAWCIAKTLDNQFIIGGHAYLDGHLSPYLVRVDIDGNKTLERVYTAYSSGDYNQFYSLVATNDGGYVLGGMVNSDFDTPAETSDMVLMKVANNGDVITSQTLDIGWLEIPTSMIATNDGGILIGVERWQSPYAPISDPYGEGILVKLDANLQMEWQIEVFNDHSGSGSHAVSRW